MAATPATERLRITPRSAVVAVALLGLTLLALRVLSASTRVVGWAVAAAALAGLLHPMVRGLTRWVPRGLAVLVVFLVTGACVGIIAYGLVNGVVRSTHRLQRAAPAEAARLERGDGIHKVLRDAHLARRTRQLVRSAPQRLQGGTPADAIRSATTRGLAFLATAVLTLFLTLSGPELFAAALAQVHDPVRQARARRVALGAYERGFGYARGSIAMSAMAGLLAYALASAAAVPGAAPLALWVALWDLVPVLGALIGSLPIIGLAAAGSPNHAILLTVAFVAYEVLEDLVLQRFVERRTIRLGPFATAVGGLVGLELYGIGGALIVVLGLAVAVAAVDELAPR